MMKPLRKFVASLIGFDRRERRGTYVLSLILIALLLVRMVAFRPGKLPGELPPLPGTGTAREEGTALTTGETASVRLFAFDPNTALPEELQALGLSERQSKTLVNYRNSGARFRKPEDIGRVYGIDSATVARLIPYINIVDDYTVRGGDNFGAGGYDRGGDNPGAGAYHRVSDYSGYGGSAGGRKDAEPVSDMAADGADHPEAIDLNLCTAEDLVTLPGIGPVLSVRIIRYRSLLGGFVESSQLKEVYGLDSSVVRLIESRLTLTLDSVRPLSLDSVTFGDLARHPYLGYEAARRITRYRSVSEEPLTLGVMVSRGVITPEQAEHIAPYVRPAKGASGSDYEFISSKVLK